MFCDDFSTADLPARTQFDAWQGWYRGVFDVAPHEGAEGGFVARNRSWKLDGLALNFVSAPGISVSRTKALIRREPVDHWAITLAARQVTNLDFGSSCRRAMPGVPFVVSLGQAMTNRRAGDDRIQLYLARDTFYALSPLLDACCMSASPMPENRLLADYMRLMMDNLPKLDVQGASRLVDVTRAMIAACLSPGADRMAEARLAIHATLMERVRRTVRSHLRSPALGVELICGDAGTSRSQLYRLLEGEGGVVRYILKRRLAEAFALLCDTSVVDSVATIARALCFADASSFSRAFRREFGLTPSDVRAAAQAGVPPIRAAGSGDDPAVKSFADCLRGA